MEENGKRLESGIKEGQPTDRTTSNTGDDEISLDRFLHLAGIESAQLEALCSPGPSEDTGATKSVTDSKTMLGATASKTEEEETAAYRRKLAAYQESQGKQAQLIQKLQTKLQSTTENLNSRIEAAESRARVMEQERSYDLESALSKLQEEQQRSGELTRANELLRDQLDQAVQANQGLSQDVARLTLAWRHAAQQLDKRETEWREEENAFNDYFAAEHSRLLALWRAVVGLRRQFSELRQQTERDLAQARNEFDRHARNIQSVCGNLEVNLQAAEAQTQATWKRESKNASALEAEAAERVRTLTESLAKSQARLAETENLLTESNAARERLAIQLADRDRILNTMKQLRSNVIPAERKRHGKTTRFRRSKKRLHTESQSSDEEEMAKHLRTDDEELEETEGEEEDHLKATKQLIEQTHVMHQALSQIAQLVISDCVIADSDEAEDPGLKLTISDRPDLAVTPKSDEPLSIHVRSDQSRISPRIDYPEKVESDQRAYGLTTSELDQLRQLVQSKYQAGSSSHLAESTVFAVQSALHRRAAHVHRLRYRTHGLKDQLQSVARRTEELDQEKRRNAEQINRLRDELATHSLEMDKIMRENERIKHNLSLTMEEKQMGETAKMSLNEQIHDLQTELERMRASSFETGKQKDELLAEKERIQIEYDRLVRESAAIKTSLEGAEQRAATYREELATIRESLRKTELARDVLDQEKMEALGAAGRVQNKINTLEQKLTQYQMQETQLKDRIAELEVAIETHERDNKHLTQQNALAHSTELRLTEERSGLRAEVQQLREELNRLYAERGNLTTDAEQSKDTAIRLEATRKRLEAENAELTQERLVLIEALNNAERQKTVMIEDLESFRRDNERQTNLLNRLNREKESLSKQKAEVLIQVSILERDARQHLDNICRLKEEKETLEANLFDAHQMIQELENKHAGQERELAELRLRRDSLQAELSRAHNNFQIELDKSQRSNQHLGTQLNSELAGLRQALAQTERRAKEAEDACLQAVLRADQAVAAMGRHQKLEAESYTDREAELRRSAEEVNRLTRALLMAQSERDEARLHAEQEHQLALLKAADEKAGLQERVTQLQHTITELQNTLDRRNQEGGTRDEHDRSALKRANEEVRSFRNQLEDARVQYERETRELRIRINDLEAQRDQLIKETNDLQLQIRLAEETREGSRNDFLDSTHRMRAAEEAVDSLRRDCVELRQKLSELEREKIAIDGSNEELRRQLRESEKERVELVRISNVTRAQLQDTEMDRHTAERRATDMQENARLASLTAVEIKRELSESRLAEKRLLYEKKALEQEVKELRDNLSEAQNREENLKREKLTLKQRISDMEGLRTDLHSEVSTLTRQLTEMQEVMRSRDRATNEAAEQWHQDYRRMDETRQNLEDKIEHSNLVIGELRATLAETQAHLHGLEVELSDTLVSRQEAETRLSAIHSILRRLLGFRQSQYSERLVNSVDQYRLMMDPDGSSAEWVDYPAVDDDENRLRKSKLAVDINAVNRVLNWRRAQMEYTGDEGDNSEWELRRMADRVISGQHGYPQATEVPKPRQRSRRRLYEDRIPTYEQPRSMRTSMKIKRSKSSSPPRDKKHSWISRPTSVERPPGPREFGGDAYLMDSTAFVQGSPNWLRMVRMHINGIRYRGLPGSDLDPEAVRMVIKDFLKHLVTIERDRDTKIIEIDAKVEQIKDRELKLKKCEQEKQSLESKLSNMEKDKKEILDQLDSLRLAISDQEIYFSKREKDSGVLREKLQSTEQRLEASEVERSQLQERLDKLKASELRSDDERRQLSRALDDAESRYTDAEVARRRLEGDLKRTKSEISELEKAKQTLQTRLEELLRQFSDHDSRIKTLETENDQLTLLLKQANEKCGETKNQLDKERANCANLKEELVQAREKIDHAIRRETGLEQETRALQEKLNVSRTALGDAKTQLHEAMDRLRQLQDNLSDGSTKRVELENQVKQLTTKSSELQLTINDLQTKLATAQTENLSINEKNSNLLRQANDLSLANHELENELKRIRKSHNQIKKSIDRMEKDRTREQELSTKLHLENKELSHSVQRVENENADLHREVQKLQVLLSQHEDTQAARMVESKTKQRLEIEAEMEKQRASLAQAEKTLEAKERSYRLRVRGLEEQVSFLKDQLAQEVSKRQLFITKPSSQVSEVSPSLTEADPIEGPGRTVLRVPHEPFILGRYKPTIWPSRYDPYFYQVTGSIPARLDRSGWSGSVDRSRGRLKAGSTSDDPRHSTEGDRHMALSRSFATGSTIRVPGRYATSSMTRQKMSHSHSETTIGREDSGDTEP